MPDELKPCPFCGDVAEMYVTKHIPNGYDYTPRCTNPSCCGRLSKKYNLKETAEMQWNRRVENA
ncbi:MAG: Lar family restriction alleviation protein [Clostridia bacterium]|nr:Lar family restriction alleviation protein [Clostridia bacterium]